MPVTWKVDTYLRYRPRWGERPSRRGWPSKTNPGAVPVCSVGDCDSPAYSIIRSPNHRTLVCLKHADQLYEDGYVFEAEV